MGRERKGRGGFMAPPYPLLGDTASQPRTSLKNFSTTQMNTRNKRAKEILIERQRKSTEQLLKKRMRDADPETDDRVFAEVYQDIPIETFGGMQSLGGYDDSDGEGDQPSWVEEELDKEEILLYEQAKGAYQSFDFKDYKNRRDKVEMDQERWAEELPSLVDAYLDFCYRRRVGGAVKDRVLEYHAVRVYNIFYNRSEQLCQYVSDKFHNQSYVRQGYLPFNPLLNTTVVTLETIELFHSLTLRCPRLSIQSFVKSLCDLQGFCYKDYLSVQFSSAHDVYIRILEEVRLRVRKVLRRDEPNWRMMNACPCCQYEVEGEDVLPVRMLIAVDGNNSLKRMERREKSAEGDLLGLLKERLDSREGGGDYFMANEHVNRWDEPQWSTHPGFKGKRRRGKKTPCADRFSNMNEAKIKKEFGVFSETGVFVGLCRHCFVLKILDMMRSGEQSKYVLAFLDHFLSACREDRKARGFSDDPEGNLGVGYDIACNLIEMIARSSLNDLATKEKLQMLIGIPHAYAHNRLCQLVFLLIYVFGAGLEDLEVCERFFSQSNALAPVTRYQSRFHRRQTIAQYAYHQDNFEAYANLSKFLYSKYTQSLQTLATWPLVSKGMKENGVKDMSVFSQWLTEEKAYLESRKSTPELDALTMDYYSKPLELESCSKVLEKAKATLRVEIWDPTLSSSTEEQQNALRVDREIRNAQQKRMLVVEDLHVLEGRLDVGVRWTRGSEQWIRAEKMVREHKYQKALDKLEGLLVARMFELHRLNMAGTGYKMRQHIGQAMKTRSTAIRNALDAYNQAASLLDPPRPALQWTEIVEHSFLSEFDFLKDTHSDVREKPWAKPAVRQLMSQAFKIARAEEELKRDHVEIKRLVTNMKEEGEYLDQMSQEVYQTDRPLALQVHLYAKERGRFNEQHRMRLKKITKLKGFDRRNLSYFRPGIGKRRQTLAQGGRQNDDEGNEGDWETAISDTDDEGNSEGEEEEAAHLAAQTVLGIANDNI